MEKKKRMLLMLLGGGMSQSDIATVYHVSKRDVSAAAKAIKSSDLNVAIVQAMSDKEVDELLRVPKPPKEKNPDYLQPDIEALVKRKKGNRKLPVKLMWLEYCDQATQANLLAYSYQTFCEAFATASQKAGATRHFNHVAAEKVYIDWAGEVAWLTDRFTNKTSKVYLLVVCLPASGYFFVEGFCDMKQDSWLKGNTDAFEFFGGVPHMLVPDNCSTATDRTPIYITLINKTYERYAEHYGTAVVPARVRKPRDKSLAETTVNLVEQWIIAPAHEMVFYTLDDFNDFVAEKRDWLNSRPFSDKPGSRAENFDSFERSALVPLPPTRFETYIARRAKAGPDYHIRIDNMHYSVPFSLLGEYCDVRVYAERIVVVHAGDIVAEHPRLHGRTNQYHTLVEHMPPNHAQLDSPWSSVRFEHWASRIGPATLETVRRVMASRVIVQQSFVSCRNILGLSKSYTPELLERSCARIVATQGAVPSYSAVKNCILAIKAFDEGAKKAGRITGAKADGIIDRAKEAGRVQGADAWKRKGE